jgi:dihydropteroate synthase
MDIRVRFLKSLAENQIIAELLARGADAQAIQQLSGRLSWVGLLLSGLSLNQSVELRKLAKEAGLTAMMCRPLLAAGARRKEETADVVLAGTAESLGKFAQSLAATESGLQTCITRAVEQAQLPRKRDWVCGKRHLALGQKTLIMGILNATPDSFSGDGFGLDIEAGFRRAAQMAAEGAEILDIGGESTRPGAETISADEEIKRVLPLIDRIAAELDVAISIDTTKAQVAEAALAHGACIVNDISGLHEDAEMPAVAAKHQAGVVIMHIRGKPRDMQQDPQYADLMGEITVYLSEGIARALAAGIAPAQIVVDPGIGFGKTVEHNLEILRRLEELRVLGYPILVGTSRKSTIGKILGEDITGRLEGTAATVALAIAAGAEIVRVHDVKEMAKVAKMADAILRVQRPEPPEEEVVHWGN